MKLFEKLFGRAVNAQRGVIYAPADGTLMPLEQVPDASFAQGFLGKGCGIDLDGSAVYAPLDGTLTALTRTLHAVGITTDDGAELLIHIGVDTVNLNGRGFRALVKKGEKVKCGQKLIAFDRGVIEAAGLSPTICFTVCNSDELAEVAFKDGGSIKHGDELGGYKAEE